MKRRHFLKNSLAGTGGVLFSTGIFSLFTSACTDKFLDLDPEDQLTEAAYFNKPEQFRFAANDFYNKMIDWQFDIGSDLTSALLSDSDLPYARGNITVPDTDANWDNQYKYIRANNILIEKSEKYQGNKEDIKGYVAEAKFFRAWHHFALLKRFGGVPVVITVLDLDSPELQGSRNSRYEVISQILTDLDEAIPDLPPEQAISATDKGHISKWAAEAFKAGVLLYEATWEKYVKTSTDGDGTSAGAGTKKPENYPSVSEMLTEAISLSKEVMDNGGYELWDYNDVLNNQSYYYLFCLEDAESNPAGLDKSTNKEFILKSVYDYNLRRSGEQITHIVTSYLLPSRKMVDMYLCKDGLPVDKSPLFKGYHKVPDEYQGRDYRMLGYIGETPASGSVILDGGAGYGNRKFAAYHYGSYRNAREESQDYPHIRLAEVYLIYAEALLEKDGAISDADLDASINKIHKRAGIAPLTNALAQQYDLDLLEYVRNERSIELYGENKRFDDLKRWGIAEKELNEAVTGMVVGDASYPTEFRNSSGEATSLYKPNTYVYGELKQSTGAGDLEVVVMDAAANRNFQRKHYLYPIPLGQISLNTKLKQNPDY